MGLTNGHLIDGRSRSLAGRRAPGPVLRDRMMLAAMLVCGVSGFGNKGASAETSTAWAASVRSNLAAQGALDPTTETRFSAQATTSATTSAAMSAATSAAAALPPAALPPAPAGHPVTAWARAVRSQLASRAHRVADAGRSALAWSERGMASWYDLHHSGRVTASGARFNPMQLTCAHPTLPLGTRVLVTSDRTGRSVVVTVNDRGPFGGRIVDLSRAAAARIGMLGSGTTSVTLQQATPDVIEVAQAADGDTSDQAIVASGTR